MHKAETKKVPALPECPFFGGWVIDTVNKLYGRLEGGECYGKTQPNEGPLFLFFPLAVFCASVLFPRIFIFFFAGLAFLLLLRPLHLSFLKSLLPHPSPSFLTPPLPLPSSPQSIGGNEEEVLGYCNSPSTCTAELLQTFLLIFTGL